MSDKKPHECIARRHCPSFGPYCSECISYESINRPRRNPGQKKHYLKKAVAIVSVTLAVTAIRHFYVVPEAIEYATELIRAIVR